MVYEAAYYCFVFGGIFVFTYEKPGSNLYNFYTFPDCTWRNFGLLMKIF